MNRKQLCVLTQGGTIAALYVALTFAFQPISFGEVQVRIAEALTILPVSGSSRRGKMAAGEDSLTTM